MLKNILINMAQKVESRIQNITLRYYNKFCLFGHLFLYRERILFGDK